MGLLQKKYEKFKIPAEWEYNAIEDWIKEDTDRSLHEIALPRKMVFERLELFDMVLNTFIFGLFFYRNIPECADYLVMAILKCCFCVQKVKKIFGKPNWPDADDIYKGLFGHWHLENSNDLIYRLLVEDFNNKETAGLPQYLVHLGLPMIEKYTRKTRSRAILFMKGYYHWLANQLSAKGMVTLDEVKAKFSELFEKYPL